MNRPAFLWAVLALTGLAWGFSIVLTRMVMLFDPPVFGVILWQLLISVAVLSLICRVRGQSLRPPAGTWPFFTVIAFIGTLIPNSFSYWASAELPAGIMSIAIALVPMFALPIALVWGNERFSAPRFLGIGLGALAVVCLFAPSTALPEPEAWPFVLIAMIAPFCYGVEGNYVDRYGLRNVSAEQVLLFASAIGAVVLTPVVLARGEIVVPQTGGMFAALLGLGLLHALAYTVYVWLVDRAGAVFSAQVSYLVHSRVSGCRCCFLASVTRVGSGWRWF